MQQIAREEELEARKVFANGGAALFLVEADEFGALVLAILLEDNMRHKIGYDKPLGLGSVQLTPTRLTLIDYAARYTQTAAGARKNCTGEARDVGCPVQARG